MKTTVKKTFDELRKEMDDFFNGIKVNVTHYKDSAVAIVRIKCDYYSPCDSCRVLLSKANEGEFDVYIPSDELPLVEKNYIRQQHFNNVADAYNFVVTRAKQINEFFKH